MSDALRGLLEFNFRPLRYIHPSWIKEMNHGDLVMQLKESERTEFRLSNYVLNQLDLFENYVFEFPALVEKIVLMLPEDLLLFSHYIGCVINGETLRQRIDGESVRSIRSSIDNDAYTYGLHRSSYFSSRYKLSGFRLSSQFGIAKKVIQSGVASLYAVAEESGNGVAKRTLLKLPKPWSKGIEKVAGKVEKDSLRKFVEEIFNEVVQP